MRYYDHTALEQLAYAQLWHNDGMMVLIGTAAVVEGECVEDRRALIAVQRDAMLQRIRRLTRAAAVLEPLQQQRAESAGRLQRLWRPWCGSGGGAGCAGQCCVEPGFE